MVVTTINAPTRAVVEIQEQASRLQAQFILIGDSKSPPDFDLPGARYLNMDEQLRTGFRFARLCPPKHYARKNVGYLVAAQGGASIIIETDDDNIPREGFWSERRRTQTAPTVQTAGWCNVYRYFTDTLIWPRGLPLNQIKTEVMPTGDLAVLRSDCPIQQGLADENPDVDAIFRLTSPLPVSFEPGRKIVLDAGVWCPFNSQNTTFWREAFPLLYLPYYCSFRMTDIWRSFVSQRIGWAAGWKLQFHSSTVFQERNEHDLMIDFAEEIPGYLHNDRIRKTLEDADFESGAAFIYDNLRKAYDLLIGLDVVGADERKLLSAWIDDLQPLLG